MTETSTTHETERYSNPAGRQGVRFVLILTGREDFRQIDLMQSGKSSLTFGRGSDGEPVDIRLNSPIVSRLHGRFFLSRGQWTVEDLSSTNGTLYNGTRISSHTLSDGDILRIDGARGEWSDSSVVMLMSSGQPESGWSRFPLKGDEVTIGRSGDSDLVLPSMTVSRLHARMTRGPEGWTLINQDSKNGILVNDTPLTDSRLLRDKDVVCITDTRIIFTSDALWVCTYRSGVSVDARNVVVRRGKNGSSFVTSDHVSLSVSPGELVAVVGGSGAGKSTLMNVLCGYLSPQEGSVCINGMDLYRNTDIVKKLFGYVPQSDIVYGSLTVREMLRFTADLRLPGDTSPEEKEAAILSALRMVGLEEKQDSLIRRLSGGQRKRASIAVELVSDPRLLFLDEPTSGLDPSTERSLMLSLREMARNGKTVILVTHSTLQLGMCDRIVFLGSGGRLCYYGSEQDALGFFGKDDIVDVYAELSAHAPEWQDRFRQADGPAEPVPEVPLRKTRQKKARLRQFLVMSRRYLTLVLHDRQRLTLLMLQAPLLALLVSLVADGQQFRQYEMTKSLLFALSCSGFWIGTLNAIQEICKERTILKREYMTGLSLSSYVFSKAFVLGILCLVQCALLLGVFALRVGIPDSGMLLPPLPELFVSCFLTAMAAAAMGLFVSSLFSNPDRAMTVAPLLLMPQILFSGLLFRLSGVTRYLSVLTACRWSMEGLGTTADLNALQLALQQQGLRVRHEPEAFFEHTAGHLLLSWCILAAFIALFLILARCLLTSIKRSER